MTRIVHLMLGKANPERMNGINRISHNLALAQHRAGWETELWGITSTPGAPTLQREYGLRLFAPGLSRFHLPRGFAEALDTIGGRTVFHLHGGLLPEFFATTRRLEQRGIEWVVTPHGCYSESAFDRKRWLKRLYIRCVDREVVERARAVHVNSEPEAEDVRRLFPECSVAVIANGQSLDEVRHESVPIERPARPVFGFLGRLACRHKGLDLALRGFAAYREQGGRGALWLIGDGTDRGLLGDLARQLGVEHDVWFHGPRFGADKCNRVAHFDVFIHTSRHEGMPMAVLEAAALERPLLISRGTNLADDVERWGAGIVLSENDPAHIAAAMRSFDRRTEGELRRLGEQARRMVESDFTWDRAAERCVRELYGLAEAPSLAAA